jgi:hypothetical protein
MTGVMWFRCVLVLADHPVLLPAVSDAVDTQIVPLFVLDPALGHLADAVRCAYGPASLDPVWGTRFGARSNAVAIPASSGRLLGGDPGERILGAHA